MGALRDNEALAGVALWIECGPGNQRVAGGFPVGAHAWVAGQVPSRGRLRSNHTLMFPSLSPSLPLSLKINRKSFLKKKTF